MARKHVIDDEDRDSFAQAVEGARPLGGRGEYVKPVRKAAPSKKPARDHESDRIDDRPGAPGRRGSDSGTRGWSLSPAIDDLPRNSGIPKKTMRQLAGGKRIKRSKSGCIPGDITIDLHGMRLKDAERSLMRFLDDCSHKGKDCVLVIHGKGHGSPHNRTTIKANIGAWLSRHHAVLASHFALGKDGGTGACYVLLRRSDSGD
ncbi:MAG: Smr/MutS family protein [Ectothiorhodospiraceae bacterium AqS1]|nr:Smr/MutS family protein [Ectothiorhodospiraceae bacterium AqS1]